MTAARDLELSEYQQGVLDGLQATPSEWEPFSPSERQGAEMLLLVAIGAVQVRWSEKNGVGLEVRLALGHEQEDEGRRRGVLLGILKSADDGEWTPIPTRMRAAVRSLAEADIVEVRPAEGFGADLSDVEARILR